MSKPKSKEDTRAALARWRAGEEITLPQSGLVVRARRVGLLDIVTQAGDIPVMLGPQIERLKGGGIFDVAALVEFEPVINALCKLVIIDPPVTDEPSEDTLGIKELPFDDRVVILQWVTGEAALLQPFRVESKESVETA